MERIEFVHPTIHVSEIEVVERVVIAVSGEVVESVLVAVVHAGRVEVPVHWTVESPVV